MNDSKTKHIPFPESALNQSIIHRFEYIASKFGTKNALVTEQGEFTYNHLLQLSLPLRSFLQKTTVPGQPVALLLPQGHLFISGMLGCLAAANPYCPIDSKYPLQRIQLMLEVVNPIFMIACKETADLAHQVCGDRVEVVLIEDLKQTTAAPIRADADSFAYLLFTSGSTGRPKAVLDCHRNILHNVLRQSNSFFFTSDDCQSLLYTSGVYGGARDIFCSTLNGATLCHYDIEKNGYGNVGDWLEKSKVTIYCSVSTIFRYAAQSIVREAQVKNIRIIKLGGEASRKSDIDIFKKYFSKSCIFYTGLASTETGTACQYPVYSDSKVESALLPLGRPVTDMRILIRGDDGQFLTRGETGEIVVESRYLSLGYFQNDEQTALKFINEDGKRYYRTGDLGKIDSDGCLWHCGRGDSQIKIRGNRIELGEVEAAFLSQSEVADVVVMARKDGQGEDHLVTYVVAKVGRVLDQLSLRKKIEQAVPSFMVPTKIIVMPTFVRTVNGKIDRGGLPDPFVEEVLLPCLKTNSDSRAGAIWKKVLKVDAIDPHENFFSMGGHSLHLAQLLSEVQKSYGFRIAMAEFLRDPTLASLESLIATKTKVDAA